MASNSGSSTVTALLAIVGVGLVGLGGMNYMRTGCPLGMYKACDSVAVQSVAAGAKSDSCCPVSEGATVAQVKSEGTCSDAKGACDSEKSCDAAKSCEGDKAAAVVNAAGTKADSKDATSCCKGKTEGCCKEDGGSCTDSACATACKDAGKTEAKAETKPETKPSTN